MNSFCTFLPYFPNIFHCLGHSKESPIASPCVIFYNRLIFFMVSCLPLPNPQVGGPSFISCSWLLIQYIHNLPPYLEAVPLLLSYLCCTLHFFHALMSFFPIHTPMTVLGYALCIKHFNSVSRGVEWSVVPSLLRATISGNSSIVIAFIIYFICYSSIHHGSLCSFIQTMQ